MKVLVTGSSGFVGQSLVPYLKKMQWDVMCLDKDETDDTHYNMRYLLGSFQMSPKPHPDIFGDVDVVIHLASESHVDRSISGPKPFIDNNVGGTLEMLEIARTAMPKLKLFLHFSTDEVGACLDEGSFYEEYKFHCGSVYSASKGAQELLVQAYLKTFNLPIVTTRCVNIFGKHQADEKFLPTVCRKAMKNEAIPVYGSGMQKRQWVSVDHVCEFVNYVASSNFVPPGSVLHITGTHEFPNILMAHTILNLLNKPASLISHVADRLGHDQRYSLGRTEKTDAFGCPKYDEIKFMEDLKETVKYYEEKYK